ncbi:MAG: hypothetical protein Q8K81_03460 [Sulfuricurvum sp.]|nr:hypothetical protein [Sulfuricurvum sp.]
MLDISKLERRWLKYKIKRSVPYIFLITTGIIFSVTIMWLYSDNHQPKKSVTASKTLPITIKAAVLPGDTHSENTMLLEPSMQFMQSIEIPAEVIPSSTSLKKSIATSPRPAVPSPPVSTVQTPKVPIPLSKSTQPIIKGKLTSIKRDDATFDIHELEERFKNNSNPNLGLYIARYHYDHANYSEAYNYALKTNALNTTLDESWLIFAKSLVKLGKTDQAKKTLQLYISNSNSESAKNFLDTLNKESSK